MSNPGNTGLMRTCSTCKVPKPNTLDYFGKRYEKRHAPTTLDSRCKQCRRRLRKEWGLRNVAQLAATAAERRLRVRMLVLVHYSIDGTPACRCCGEAHVEFLSIDHIDGEGTRHRKAIGKVGASFYAWLVKQGLPTGYRVLCHNCNMAMGFYGTCPHQDEGENHGKAHLVDVATLNAEVAS